jgi:leader peptidase (prepilin peptidase)/N-methyltransferase
MLFAALVGGGVLLVITLASRGGMGIGDVKFAAVLGLWMGVQHIVLTLFLSFLIGGIGGVVLLALKLKSRKDAVPFGPYLAVGAFIAILYGNTLLRWYIVNFL